MGAPTMLTSGSPTSTQLTMSFTAPPASIDQTGYFSLPPACNMAFVISARQTKKEATPSHTSSVGPISCVSE